MFTLESLSIYTVYICWHHNHNTKQQYSQNYLSLLVIWAKEHMQL